MPHAEDNLLVWSAATSEHYEDVRLMAW